MRIRFLGRSNSYTPSFGDTSAVVLFDNDKHLVIDYGNNTFATYLRDYKRFPDAVVLTHLDMARINAPGSFFHAAIADEHADIQLFVPEGLRDELENRMFGLNNMRSGSLRGFYDAFEVIFVEDKFVFNESSFSMFAASQSGHYGLAMPGKFVCAGEGGLTSDVVSRFADKGEVIFHDATVDMGTVQNENVLRRLWCYHLGSQSEIDRMKSKGLNVISDREFFAL